MVMWLEIINENNRKAERAAEELLRKMSFFLGKVFTEEEKTWGLGQSPGNHREIFKEIAFHASVLLGHGGA